MNPNAKAIQAMYGDNDNGQPQQRQPPWSMQPGGMANGMGSYPPPPQMAGPPPQQRLPPMHPMPTSGQPVPWQNT
jgi:hypothetical protein